MINDELHLSRAFLLVTLVLLYLSDGTCYREELQKQETISNNSAQVTVEEGILEGEFVANEYDNSRFYSFKGIPYAEPPVGELRFKAPRPKTPWQGVRQAKDFGSECFQLDIFNADLPPFGSEDCLFLNIYTPDLTPVQPLPVMFWIHGGGFVSGSGNYDPQFLVRHGVIIVTINYRLEALGFLSLESEEIPGNAGMKDQVAALRWVKKNIKSFGGDPDNVTIFGQSAGGASVSFHLVSPMTKGLFKRAIAMSGSLATSMAQMLEPREMALKLAIQLGFYSENDKELYEFFKTVPVEKLVGLQLPVVHSSRPFEFYFSIANEKQFGNNERYFYGDVIELLRNGIHDNVAVITGYTEDEGLLSFMLGVSLQTMITEANAFKQFYVPAIIQENNPVRSHIEIGRKVKEFYFGNEIVKDDNKDNLIRYLSWDLFDQSVSIMAQMISLKNTVYLYKFSCKSERNIHVHRLSGLDNIIGDRQAVNHGDDLLYLFPQEGLSVDQNGESFQMINRFTTLWTNFAKFGYPTTDNSLGVQWSPFTLRNRSFLEIGNSLVAGTSPDQEDQVFWDSIYKEYLPSWSAESC